jgi:hypothetical protein
VKQICELSLFVRCDAYPKGKIGIATFFTSRLALKKSNVKKSEAISLTGRGGQ